MGRIEYKMTYLYCPKCKQKFGNRRIGPAQIECGSCGEVLDTDLPTWDQLSTSDKLRLYLSEIILPSWLGVKDCNGIMVGCLTQVFLWAMVSMPFMAIMGPLMDSPDDSSPLAIALIIVMMLVIPFAYPAILALRVRRMARESQKFTETGQPPIWGKKERVEEEEIVSTARYTNSGYEMLLRLVALSIFPVFILAVQKTMYTFLYTEAQLGDIILIVILWLVTFGAGTFLRRELSLCLGRSRKIGVISIIFTPFILAILALGRHKVDATIAEIKQMDREMRSSRAKYIDPIDHAKRCGVLLSFLEDTRDPRSVKPLMRALYDRENRFRIIAAKTLGEIGDAKAIEALLRTLKDKDVQVRAAAAVSLGKIKDRRAKAGLEALIEDEDQEVRDAAKEGLRMLELDPVEKS